jgi:hypothetical protein
MLKKNIMFLCSSLLIIGGLFTGCSSKADVQDSQQER